MWNRRFLLLALAALATGACRRAPDASVLRVGLDPTYPPFEMRDSAGNLTGVSVDLAEAIGRHLGRRVEFVPMDFQGLEPALKTGKIDAIISSMTASPERAKRIAFSKPYVENGLCLLVPANSNLEGTEALDQPGRTVVVRTGTTGHTYASQFLTKAKVIPQELAESCANEVLNGNVDAFLYDQLSVLEYASRHPGKVKAIAKPFQKEPWAVAVRKEDTALLDGINSALDAMGDGGPLAQAFDKYPVLRERRDQLAAQGQPFIFLIGEKTPAPVQP
ncbi:MAG: transporter substrate-binding domain-containing protein [Verrucomicrobiales bacterium]